MLTTGDFSDSFASILVGLKDVIQNSFKILGAKIVRSVANKSRRFWLGTRFLQSLSG
jgi:hypothetical protein